MLRINGQSGYIVVCQVPLEDLLASLEAPKGDFGFQQLREHLSAGCANCVHRVQVIRDLLRDLIEPGSGEF